VRELLAAGPGRRSTRRHCARPSCDGPIRASCSRADRHRVPPTHRLGPGVPGVLARWSSCAIHHDRRVGRRRARRPGHRPDSRQRRSRLPGLPARRPAARIRDSSFPAANRRPPIVPSCPCPLLRAARTVITKTLDADARLIAGSVPNERGLSIHRSRPSSGESLPGQGAGSQRE
jgi:hypothetical protein